MLELQDYRCANDGCGISFCNSERYWTRPHIDHCHKTQYTGPIRGSVRGLLCRKCNSSLGFARDEPEIMRGLADYVERSISEPLRLPGPAGRRFKERVPDYDSYRFKKYVAPGEEEYEREFQFVESLRKKDPPGTYRKKIRASFPYGRKHHRPYLYADGDDPMAPKTEKARPAS